MIYPPLSIVSLLPGRKSGAIIAGGDTIEGGDTIDGSFNLSFGQTFLAKSLK